MTNTNLNFYLNSIWKGKGVKDAEKAMSNLDKQSKGLADTLKAVAVGAAALKFAGLIKDSVMLAARVETLGIVTEHMGTQMGMSELDMRGLEQSIIDLGITTQGSRQIIAQMIMSNIDLANATDIARIAQNAAVVANVDSSEAAQRLTTILQTGNVRMGRTLGLQLNFQKSYQEMAEKIGKAVTALSEEEKMQARVNEVKKSAVRIEGVYEKAMGSSGKMMGSMTRLTEELQLLLGEQLLPAFGSFVEVLYGLTHDILEFNRALDYLEESADYAMKTFGPFEWIVDSTGQVVANTSEEIIALYHELQALEEPTEVAAEGLDNVGGSAEFVGTKFDASYIAMRNAEGALGGIQVAAGLAGEAIDLNLTGSIERFLDEIAFVLGGGGDLVLLFQQIKDGVMTGKFTPEEGQTYLGELFVVAQDLQVDLGNITADKAAENIRNELGGSLDDAQSKLDNVDQTLDSLARTVDVLIRIRTEGEIPAYQHGGKLTGGIAMVGEAGPELIIGDVVIPADLTRRLIALGLMPGQGFQYGGELTGRLGSRPRTAAPGSVEAWESVGGGPGTAGVITGIHETYGGGGIATVVAASTAAAEVVVEEIVDVIEQSVAEIPGAVADISSQQLAIVQTQMRQQERLTREQTRVLSDILAAVKILATTEGITESLLGGLQAADLG